MVDRIACFFTCGYTESGAMQVFLGKINPQYEFKQYLPNKTRKRKGDPKSIAADLSGLSGNSLLEKIYAVLDLPVCKKEIMQCKAILIEDDLDGKFHGWSEKMIREYQDKITVAVCSHLGKEIPVILLYASPEIEAWFVADWDNSFQYMLLNGGWGADITREAREYFNYQLRHYVNVSILREYTDQIEEYGYFDGKYYKLSDQLICAIERNAKDYVVEITRQNSGSEGLADQIKSSRTLYYSKKTHGQRMLKNIDPRLVASKCRRYFRPVYNELLVFNNR